MQCHNQKLSGIGFRWSPSDTRAPWLRRPAPTMAAASGSERVATFVQYERLKSVPSLARSLVGRSIDVAKSTVEKYQPCRDKPPSPTWRTFLNQHVQDLVAIDFFLVPTSTLRVLFVFVVLAHDRRRIVHLNVTEHPTAQWTAQQLVEAFPFDTAPRYLIRDGDGIYGERVTRRIEGLGIDEVVTAPRSPWQNAYVEWVIGSLRRELLDHVIILNERHLERLLSSYLDYCHPWRTHRSLDQDAP